MRHTPLLIFVISSAIVVMLAHESKAQQPPASAIPSDATAFAQKHLSDIAKSFAFAVGGSRQDFVFVGNSRSSDLVTKDIGRPDEKWKILIVSGGKKASYAVSRSFVIGDGYLSASGPAVIDASPDGADSYIVTMTGCAPQDCTDGRLGFLLYSSQKHRIYRAHVTTEANKSYRVAYDPKGVPAQYRAKLNQMMCSDDGISRPSALPIKCPAR
jgi:hypothetical protein